MKYIYLTLVILLSGCATTGKTLVDTDAMRVIEKAAEMAPESVSGEFIFTVLATGEERNIVYLNTQLDYRDGRNVTIALSPFVAEYLKTEFDSSPLEYFVNKRVKVKGEAEQVKIWFSTNGRRTDKYYFQTHIRVKSPAQIEVLE